MRIFQIKICSVLYLCIASFISHAQPYGEITYKERIGSESQKPELTYKLFFNHAVSVYEEDLSKTQFGQIVIPEPDGKFNVITVPYRKDPIFVYTTINERKRVFQNFLLGEKQTVEDRFEKINWELKEDTKQIGSFECQKAVGNFRGRNYIAWFTTQIPVSFGPWKLQGLNGLILEAYEEYGLYSAVATEINIYRTETAAVSDKIATYSKISPVKKFENYVDELKVMSEKFEKISLSKLSKGQTPMADNYSVWMLEKF